MLNFNQRLQDTIVNRMSDNICKLNIHSKKLYNKIVSRYNRIVRYISELTLDEYIAYVHEMIANNDINTISIFMKNVTRQNIYENIQISILEQYFECEFDRHSGIHLDGTKSFDGVNEEYGIIVNCKYINEAGGSQDNQFNDLINFNQTIDGYTNYLVISGNYGITRMRDYIDSNEMYASVIILSDSVEIIEVE